MNNRILIETKKSVYVFGKTSDVLISEYRCATFKDHLASNKQYLSKMFVTYPLLLETFITSKCKHTI